MDKILLMDKPQKFTSFDVVAKLRGITKQKKIGHSGTLDPMATGVLVCLLGRATKLCEIFPNEDKEYCAKMKLGIISDTQDIWGKIIKNKVSNVTKNDFLNALVNFRGEICQMPPMYSAVSINGRRLYDLAREGKTIERPSRKISINALELLEFDKNEQTASLKICCSKGTYIRTLINDIGEMLGVGACMTELRRTVANGFSIDSCLSFDEVEEIFKNGDPQRALPDIYTVFKDFPKIETGKWQKKMLSNGVPLNKDKFQNPKEGKYTIWCDGEFLGVASFSDETPQIKMIFRG